MVCSRRAASALERPALRRALPRRYGVLGTILFRLVGACHPQAEAGRWQLVGSWWHTIGNPQRIYAKKFFSIFSPLPHFAQRILIPLSHLYLAYSLSYSIQTVCTFPKFDRRPWFFFCTSSLHPTPHLQVTSRLNSQYATPHTFHLVPQHIA